MQVNHKIFYLKVLFFGQVHSSWCSFWCRSYSLRLPNIFVVGLDSKVRHCISHNILSILVQHGVSMILVVHICRQLVSSLKKEQTWEIQTSCLQEINYEEKSYPEVHNYLPLSILGHNNILSNDILRHNNMMKTVVIPSCGRPTSTIWHSHHPWPMKS